MGWGRSCALSRTQIGGASGGDWTPVWSGDGTIEWIWAMKGRPVPHFGWVLLQEAHSGQGIPCSAWGCERYIVGMGEKVPCPVWGGDVRHLKGLGGRSCSQRC